jgi:hypothetical protein
MKRFWFYLYAPLILHKITVIAALRHLSIAGLYTRELTVGFTASHFLHLYKLKRSTKNARTFLGLAMLLEARAYIPVKNLDARKF